MTAPATPTSVLDLAPVLPVVVLEDAAAAVPLARALVAGGLPAIEVTLRTPAALDAIAAIAEQVPDMVVGAGTVRTAGQAADAARAGARFLVSPGATPALLDGCAATGLPFLAGAATVSEVLALAERGLREAKFFPAEPAGGTSYLRAIAGPVPEMRFCPTGGIDRSNAARYLELPNVGCVGGSWVAPAPMLSAGAFEQIEQLAREAAGLRPGR